MKNEKHHGDLLYTFITGMEKEEVKSEVAKKDAREKIKEFAKVIKKTPNNVRTWLSRESLGRNVLTFIKAGYPSFDTTLYGYTEDQFISIQSNETPVQFKEFPNFEKRQVDHALIEEYFNLLAKNIKKGKRRIAIYDYLARCENETLMSDRSFSEGLEHYYNAIRDCFTEENSKLEYARILVLPINCIRKHKTETSGEEMEKEDVIKRALDLLFPKTFHHIWESFENDDHNRFELYVCSKPKTLYSFGYVDEIIIKEHDWYDENTKAHPNMLFIYDNTTTVSNYTTEMVRIYRETMHSLLGKGRNREAPVWNVTKSEFKAKSGVLHAKAVENWNNAKLELVEEKQRLVTPPEYTSEQNAIREKIDTLTSNERRLEKIKNIWEEKIQAFK